MAIRYSFFYLTLALVTLGLSSCKQSGSLAEDLPSEQAESNSSSGGLEISLDFERLGATDSKDFRVLVHISKKEKPWASAKFTPVVECVSCESQPEVGDLVNNGDGNYQFVVSPSQTGEHKVSVSVEETSITRTALVLENVHPDWGQPQSVAGLVNTPGYEDGITISPDGQYLFAQTGAFRLSMLFVFNESRANGGCGGNRLIPELCTHPWLDTTIGPTGGSKRPGFFDGRIDGTTQLHNSNLYGLEEGEAQFAPYSTMLYGFKRQEDGTFAEPFYLAFDDLGDALINPFGLSLKKSPDGSWTIVYSVEDPSQPYRVDVNGDGFGGPDDVSSGFDIYTLTTKLGENIELGSFIPGNPPERGESFPSRLVNFGDTGTNGIFGSQGNPSIFYVDDEVRAIFTDDEFDDDADSDKISVYTLEGGDFPNGTWNKALLPESINASGREIRQPTFTGSGLFYTDSTNIAYSDFYGEHISSHYSDPSNWEASKIILQRDSMDTEAGRIIALGEPTHALLDGEEYLYFVYAYIRGFDPITGIYDLDMQAGFVKKR